MSNVYLLAVMAYDEIAEIDRRPACTWTKEERDKWGSTMDEIDQLKINMNYDERIDFYRYTHQKQ